MKHFRFAGLLAAAIALAALSAPPARAQSTGDLFSGFQAKSTDPVQIDADTLDYREEGKQRISVFSGGVVVKRGKTTLKASTIKVYSNKEQTAKNDAFTRIEASGPVYVNSEDQTLTGDAAVVDMTTQLITLTGNVVLKRGTTDVAKGHILVVNLKTGAAKFQNAPGKRLQILIQPGDAKAQAPSQ